MACYGDGTEPEARSSAAASWAAAFFVFVILELALKVGLLELAFERLAAGDFVAVKLIAAVHG
jgi:hypothetical protein